jgi:hypothetical protein
MTERHVHFDAHEDGTYEVTLDPIEGCDRDLTSVRCLCTYIRPAGTTFDWYIAGVAHRDPTCPLHGNGTPYWEGPHHSPECCYYDDDEALA